MWTRYGTTTNKIAVSYQNPDSRISLLGLIKLGNDWRISVKVSNIADKQAIQEALQAAGFHGALIEYKENDKEFVLQSYDLAPVHNFINAMRPFMHNFIDIEAAVAQLLNLNNQQNYTNPHWLRTSFGSGNILPDPHTYSSMHPDSMISRLIAMNRPSIHIDHPNYKKIEVKTSTRAKLTQLEIALSEAHFPPSLLKIDRLANSITLQNYDTPCIANFMRIIKLHALHFDEIEHEISQRFGVDFNQGYPMPTPSPVAPAPIIQQGSPFTRREFVNAVQQGTTGTNRPSEAAVNEVQGELYRLLGRTPPSRRNVAGLHSSQRTHTETASTSMNVGKNANELEHAGFSGEIPDNYICPLSLSIMTDPVFIKGDDTKQRFERSWITTWLTQKGTHPTTRVKFNSASVMPDENLKNEIDEFVQTAMTNNLGLKK